MPGAPARVLTAAEQLETMSAGLLRLAAVVQGLRVADWHGVAAAAFHELVQVDDGALGRAGAVMAQAADHLRRHATALAAAQRQADDAVHLDLRAAATSPDSGLALRAEAECLLTRARTAVQRSAALAAEGLRAATALAPERPGLLGRQLARAHERQRQVATGVVESGLDLLGLGATFAPSRLLTDPSGLLADVVAAGEASARLLVHPRQAASVALDLPTWRDDRSRWVGHALPGLALGIGTGGAAVAARPATLTARALAAVPTTRGAALRAAIRDRPGFGRSALRAADARRYTSAPSPLGSVIELPAAAHAVSRAVARDAAWAEPRTTPRIERVATDVGARRVGATTVLKGQVSLNRKLADELATAGAGARVTRVAARVNDTLRYTLVYPDEAYVGQSLRTVERLRAQGFDLAQAKSTWGGSRYQGLNLTLGDRVTGRLVEVQLHTAESWAATVRTHEAYEVFRDAGVDPAVKRRLEQQIAAEYAAVPRPPGVERLKAALHGLGTDTDAVSSPGTVLAPDPRRLLRHGLASGAGSVAATSPAPPGAAEATPR